jgi:ABC-type bacteriocin/lantibiotic exporter with double-glycine peptidase domain
MKKFFSALVVFSTVLIMSCGSSSSTPTQDSEYNIEEALIASCANADTTNLPAIVKLNVPYVRQEPYSCGPASLEMILEYYGLFGIDQYMIGKDIIQDGVGTTSDQLIAKAKEYGFYAARGSCQFEGMLSIIAEGKPLMARIINSAGTNGHIIVVTGYDISEQLVYINDPAQRDNTSMTFDEFKSRWDIQTLEENGGQNTLIMTTPSAQIASSLMPIESM